MAVSSNDNIKPAVVTVGNELTFGERRNGNQEWLCQEFFKRGTPAAISMSLPDEVEVIAHWIRHLKQTGHFPIIVSGGIGGTHDDLTRQSIADAVGRPLTKHPECFAILQARYDSDDRPFTPQRQRMADLPEHCDLIANPVGAPGFHIDGIYGLPGFPSMVQPMFETIATSIYGDAPAEEWLSVEYTLAVAEGDIAMDIESFDESQTGGHVGIYPSTEKFGREVTVRLRYPPQREDLAKLFTEHIQATAQRLNVPALAPEKTNS